MTTRIRRIANWALRGLAVVLVLFGLYVSVFFFPYPLFPHHAEIGGFSVYCDQEIPESFDTVIEDAQRRIAAMELYRGGGNLRLFFCFSQRKFEALIKLAGKRYPGQALVISAAGNAFFSKQGIEEIGQRNCGRPVYSRLEGSWAAAIAHETAHILLGKEVGRVQQRRIPPWKSEGYADFMANLAPATSDPDYDLAGRVEFLLDDDHWRPPITTFDRRHFRWHVLVEYLYTVKGFGLTELLDRNLTEDGAWREMMAWYSALDVAQQ